MKYFNFLLVLVVFFSCKSQQESNLSSAKGSYDITCPDTGSCELKVLEKTSLKVKEDDFGHTYLKTVPGRSVVLKFEYKKDVESKYEDSSYREEVFIELNANDLETKTVDLKDRKVFFARWCYCKGQTGFYKINDGSLSVSRLNKTNYLLQLDFSVSEVPQIIKRIKQNFSLD